MYVAWLLNLMLIAINCLFSRVSWSCSYSFADKDGWYWVCPVVFFVSVNLIFCFMAKSKILIKTVQLGWILIAFLASLTHLLTSSRGVISANKLKQMKCVFEMAKWLARWKVALLYPKYFIANKEQCRCMNFLWSMMTKLLLVLQCEKLNILFVRYQSNLVG